LTRDKPTFTINEDTRQGWWETVPQLGRILIVDDEPKIRSFIGRALDAAGYATESADSGGEGLSRALNSHYDLVILDLLMPDLDGRQMLGKLVSARPDQPVIVLSCVADVAAKVDCLERGAQDYLTKPFSLAELLARVRVRLRGEAHGHGEAHGMGAPLPRPHAQAPGSAHPHAEVFKAGALSTREKSLIALAVAHTVQCPYCIDAYSKESLQQGADLEQMTEAIHVAAAIRSGSSLVHGVQMLEHVHKQVMG